MTKYDRTGLGASGDFSRGNLADELREKDEIIESLERSIGVMGQLHLNHTLRNQELEEENEAYKKRIDGRDMTASNQADYIIKLQERIEELRKINDDQAKTIDKLTERLGYDIDSPYLQAEAKELEDLEDELKEVREDLEVMTLHRNNLQKERLEHIREIERLKQTKAGSNAINTIDGLTADLRDKNKKIVELKERIDTLIEERAELAKSQIAKVDELRNRIDELEELNHELIAENLRLEDGLADIGFYRDKKC